MAEFTDRYADYERKFIKLERPVKLVLKNAKGEAREEIISDLTMREPDAADIELLAEETENKLVLVRKILAVLCNVSEEIIKRLKGKDYAEVLLVFKSFMPDGLEIGMT